jgi:hypothetical protein
MNQNYKEYLENIKRKLDSMNKAAGVDPEANKEFQNHMGNQNNAMPSNDIFDMLGNGAKIWMDKQKNQGL